MAAPLPSLASSGLAVALQRRRVARATSDQRQTALATQQATADAAAAAAAQHQLRIDLLALGDATTSDLQDAVLALNDAVLPGRVCREALTMRLRSRRSMCHVATASSAAPATAAINRDHQFLEAPATSLDNRLERPVLAGFVLTETSRGHASIVLLAVAPAWRRRGGGRALLAAALTHCTAKGANTASLSVLPTNVAAIALYTQLGFRPLGNRIEAAAKAETQTALGDALVLPPMAAMHWALPLSAPQSHPEPEPEPELESIPRV